MPFFTCYLHHTWHSRVPVSVGRMLRKVDSWGGGGGGVCFGVEDGVEDG